MDLSRRVLTVNAPRVRQSSRADIGLDISRNIQKLLSLHIQYIGTVALIVKQQTSYNCPKFTSVARHA
ncbi:MAG: hypothetical protein HRU05_04845 [Oceanospirillaceae bacterium]|nr:hypothetical protein [Oceanospirillaceae bacterium]